MAAHKKGQAWSGHYTDSKTVTSDSMMHDSEGYLIQGPSERAGKIEAASARTADTISKAGMADGLSASLPKK